MEKVGRRPCRSAKISPARNAAPWATASSAATEVSAGLPETFWIMSWTMGMRVEPPTSRTRSTCGQPSPAAFNACTTVNRVRSKRSCVASSNCCG